MKRAAAPAPPLESMPPPEGRSFDPHAVRGDFPALALSVRGKALVYLDNAATTQKPRAVIDAVTRHYEEHNANVHRGVHYLAELATDAYEGARGKVAGFIGAQAVEEIVFTRGCTEAINLVASSMARSVLHPGDEVLVTEMEHHSNIVPWQMACQASGARLVVAPMDEAGALVEEKFRARLSRRTKVAAITHASNALGTVNPVAPLAAWAHEVGAAVLIDGAQAVPHMVVDVTELDVDFYAFSGHKMYGPTGIGALYARRPWLAELPPYQGGGEMIRAVTFEATTYADPPAKFEAGTPNIAGAVGLGAAIDYLGGLDRAAVAAHEAQLLDQVTAGLSARPGVEIVGTAEAKIGVASFTVEGIHPHDLATILDRHGVAIRAGHHCAQPVMERFGVPATARASVAFYNTAADVERMLAALDGALAMFGLA